MAPLPPVRDYARKIRTSSSLLAFCREYFPAKFKKPFGGIHLSLIANLERVIKDGGKQAVAMPRGSGKTTISTVAAIWAILTGRRRFVVVVAANTKEARKLLKSIATIIGTNPLLLEDFPEACYPVAKLRGSALLARGQLFYGVPTRVSIGADSFRLPTIAGSRCSASVVAAYGVKAAVRGLSAEGADGSTLRPDFLFLDDLQTDAVAINPRRVADLEEVVASALEGLVENGAEIAAVQTCTVKAPDDYADRTLNRELNPRWNGLRFASLEKMPARLDLWRHYRGLWFESEDLATAFYKRNLDAMREGAVVSWAESYTGKRYVDALEYYMTRWADNERAFWSEQQNQPLEASAGAAKLSAKAIARKFNGIPRAVLPNDVDKLTAHVDVHGDVLFYCITAFKNDFTAYVVDFGTFPEQRRAYFSKADGGLETLERAFPGQTADGRVQLGLEVLFKDLLERSFQRESDVGLDASAKSIDRVLVDVGWKPEVVENAIRRTDPRRVIPSRGAFVGAKSKPFATWARKTGRVFGWHIIEERTAKASLRSFLFDANYWKTRVHESLALQPGERGSLSIFGSAAPPLRLFSEHLSAETAKLVEYGTNKVTEWSPNVNRPDNHFFDALVGTLVAASSLGLITDDDPRAKKSNL